MRRRRISDEVSALLQRDAENKLPQKRQIVPVAWFLCAALMISLFNLWAHRSTLGQHNSSFRLPGGFVDVSILVAPPPLPAVQRTCSNELVTCEGIFNAASFGAILTVASFPLQEGRFGHPSGAIICPGRVLTANATAMLVLLNGHALEVRMLELPMPIEL